MSFVESVRMSSEKHEVLLRLRAIELLAYWEGRLVTKRLMQWFGVSRQQASNDIKRYITAHNPDSLFHEPAVKGYVPTASFRPVLTKGHINEYMELISGLVSDPLALSLEGEANLAAVQLPDRAVRPEVVREVIKACRARKSLRILYASMSNPALHERIISPHTIIYTGFRWHVRAYCHDKQEFRDFLLSRIEREPKAANEVSPDPVSDRQWGDQISLTLVPNTRLTEQQKSLVERDYAMPDGRIVLRVRAALAHYTLQRYQAAISAEEALATRRYPLQLIESDRKKVIPYLFGEGL